jgi:membrane dipeptidase
MPPFTQHHGLSPAGRTLIHEMNRTGVVMDLAQVSYKTMLDALNVTIAPVMFSHSSAYTLCPHECNVPDDMLHLVRQNEGVVVASYHPAYTRCDDPPQVSIDGVVIYIQHIGQLVGYRHVGLRFDFDSILAEF